MKTGLKLSKRIIYCIAHLNLLRFTILKIALGMEFALQFMQNVDKTSLSLILKANGAKIGGNCNIERGLILHNCLDFSKLVVGDYCHIGKNCFFDLSADISIGDYSVISMQTMLITHIDLYRNPLSQYFPHSKGRIIIENNVYLGARVIILQGSTIRFNTIVASGALIKSSFPPNVLLAGIPAQIKKEIKGIVNS